MRIMPGAQNSDRWLAAKRGRISASRIYDATATLKKGGESAARRNYRFELAAERASAIATTHYVTPEMERGLALEETARSYYSTVTETLVDLVGFVLHPLQDFAGASPDGLVGEDGLLEIKCPKTETLFAWLDSQQIPEEYLLQMQWQMACTGRAWCDFYGFDDRVPGVHFLQRVPRNEEVIAALEYGSVELNGEVEALLTKLGLPATEWKDVSLCTETAALEDAGPEDSTMITDEDVEWLSKQ